MNKKITVYSASDYAGTSTDDYSFYYGYKSAVCSKCGTVGEYCDDCEMENDWRFTVRDVRHDSKLVMSKTSAELGQDKFDIWKNLIAGMAIWGSKS